MKATRIVAATDLSEASLAAVETALSLAVENRAVLYLIFVRELNIGADPLAGIFVSDAESNEKERLSALVPKNLSVKTETVILEGSPTHEIAAFASRVNADLIVVGTHARKGISRMILGSTAESLLREAPCQVLVVKQRIGHAEPVAPEPALTSSSAGILKGGDPLC